MVHIVVDDDQARLISESPGSIQVGDRQGRHLGVVTHRVTKEEFQEALLTRKSDEPSYTTEEVLDHLRSLEKE